MSTYTIDEKNIYFLNDKNIASSLTVDKVNAIPSLDLVGDLSSTVDDISSNLVDALKGYANGISSELSGTINANREVDKAELSGTLSSYANSLCANLSAAVEQNRKDDRYELSDALSTYTNTKIQQLSTDLSTQVDREFVHISGDTVDHLVVTNGLSVASGSIVVDDRKIAIRDNLNIAASNSNIDLTSKIVDVTALSALAINCAENDFKINGESLKDIKAGLSAATFGYNHDQKSLYLKFNDDRILSVDATKFIKDGMISSVTYNEHTHIVHIVWNTDAGIEATDINLSGLIDTYYVGDGLCANAETPNIFYVDYDKVASRERLDGVLSSVSHAIKLEGHPWLDPKYSGEINILDSNLLGRHIDADPDGMLKNGLALHITLSGDPNAKFEILPRPEVKDVDDSIFVGNDDIIVVHAHHSGKLSPDEIFLTGANKSIYVFRASVPWYEFVSMSADHEFRLSILSDDVAEICSNYVWLSGDNTKTRSHAISGDNDFLGTTTVEKMIALSTVCLSDDLNVAKDVALLANVSIGKNLSVTSGLTAESISAGIISANWAKVINPSNGYSLFNLSSDLSNKIWISSYVAGDQMSGYSDLSIVKLSKNEFDATVASDSIMCANTLYVVDSDYIDAYGQAISNVSMKIDSEYKLGVAATDTYVNEICVGLSTEIKQLSVDLSGEIDNLSTALSGEIDKLSADLSGEIDKLSADLSGEIDKLSADLSGEIDKLSADLSGEIDNLSTALSGEIDKLSADLSGEIDKLSADLSGEIDNLSTNLSSAISTKIFISSYLNDDCISGYSDLSIVKLSKEEFDNLAANDNSIMCANTLYVVDSDYIDAYGQAISNVVMDDLSGKTPSEATNKTYVDAKIDKTEKYVNTQIESLSNVLSAISNAIKSDPILRGGIDNESKISSVISAVVLLFKQLSAI